jgi:hypothetical protein
MFAGSFEAWGNAAASGGYPLISKKESSRNLTTHVSLRHSSSNTGQHMTRPALSHARSALTVCGYALAKSKFFAGTHQHL